MNFNFDFLCLDNVDFQSYNASQCTKCIVFKAVQDTRSLCQIKYSAVTSCYISDKSTPARTLLLYTLLQSVFDCFTVHALHCSFTVMQIVVDSFTVFQFALDSLIMLQPALDCHKVINTEEKRLRMRGAQKNGEEFKCQIVNKNMAI